MDLDRLDCSLLRELSGDGRASHVDLSLRVGLSTTACARRIKALEDEGVIKGYAAMFDLGYLGLNTTVLVRITLNSQSEEALHKFEGAVRRCTSVIRCFLMSGSDDYLVTVLARDIRDFEHIHRTQLSCLPHVAHMQSSFALREVINRGVPPGAFGAAAG